MCSGTLWRVWSRGCHVIYIIRSLLSWILHLITHFVDLAAELYQSYSLRMALWGPKRVGVIYRVNKVTLILVQSNPIKYTFSTLILWFLNLFPPPRLLTLMHVKRTYHNCIYSRLPEDEPIAMSYGPAIRLTVEWRSVIYTGTCFCVSLT